MIMPPGEKCGLELHDLFQGKSHFHGSLDLHWTLDVNVLLEQCPRESFHEPVSLWLTDRVVRSFLSGQ